MDISELKKLAIQNERIDPSNKEYAIQQLQEIVRDLIGELISAAKEAEAEQDRQRLYKQLDRE